MDYLYQELFSDLQEYLGLTEDQLRDKLDDSHQAVVDHWNNNTPHNDKEEQNFYKSTDTYLLELAAWILDFSNRSGWNQQVSTFAEKLDLKTVLDYGCGIANEGLQLSSQGLQVDLCEVSQASLKFALWRAQKHGLNPSTVSSDNLKKYDLIVLLDVVGHVTEPVDLLIELAKHGQYLFYTEDFKLENADNFWPMHREKPVNFDRVFRGVWEALGGGFYQSLIFNPEVSIVPSLQSFSRGEGGVKRQVEALTKGLGNVDLVSAGGHFGHVHAMAHHPRPLIFTSHGFYPWNTQVESEKRANYDLKRNAAAAKAIISVSDEAKTLIEKHLNVPVHLIRNGVFLDEIDQVQPGKTQNRMVVKSPYFLWAKNSVDGVCDPTPSLELARQLPNHSFVFTHVNKTAGRLPANVLVTGPLPHEVMLEVIRDCAVYLGTTKEQFSVQTLEAMAMSKPVLCFPEGGNGKVVEHLKSGYIAHGQEDLAKGAIYCLENADKLGQRSRKIVEEHYTWQKILPQIEKVYDTALQDYVSELKRPLVSVIIPHYNLFEYVREAIDSVLDQTIKDKEIYVIDDGSPDEAKWEDLKLVYDGSGVIFIRKKNAGVSEARNFGMNLSHGKYLCSLDADDKIQPTFLETLIKPMEDDWNIGLSYCDFELFGQARGVIKTAEYNFELLKEGNFIPCCNVFRRTAWERTKGYKDINPSWEDYECWLNMGKLGFYGKKVNGPALFMYRKKGEVGRDWESQPFAERLRGIVNSFHPDLYPPKVSVIIPTYNQTHYLPDALKSLEDQTFRDFDVIVVDDGNKDAKAVDKVVEDFKSRMAVRVIHHDKNLGLASARNTGVLASGGQYILTLDSDDKIKPTFLQQTIGILEDRADLSIVYTDIELFGVVDRVLEMPEYDYDELLRKNLMSCASPYRRKVFDDVGGYPTNMKWGWEDYSFWIQAGRLGHCAARWAEPLFMYRRYDGSMIMEAQSHVSEMRKQLRDNSPDVFRGEKPMACCGKTRITSRPGASRMGFVANGSLAGGQPLVELVYVGPRPLMVRGSATGVVYNLPGKNHQQFVDPRDVAQLLSRGDFKRQEELTPA